MKNINRKIFPISLLPLLSLILLLITGPLTRVIFAHVTTTTLPFLASVDTMKVSRDTETRPLSQQEIMQIVKMTASLHTNYITVDTDWEYPAYMQEWITAIRVTGNHIWFRGHPNQWENSNGAEGLMTPGMYEETEQQFILAHPNFFQPGDIFDPCSEPEDGHYWEARYGTQWTSNAPNVATHAFNLFLRGTTDVANAAFQQLGINGVITTVHSTNSFFASQPGELEAATVAQFGYLTVDSYPEQSTTDAQTAVYARVSELQRIEQLWHVPIIIGEMGYSNNVQVDDQTQQRVLTAELAAIVQLPYVIGVNYWVGPGSSTDGGYTELIVQHNGVWHMRPAAADLTDFFHAEFMGDGPVEPAKPITHCFTS